VGPDAEHVADLVVKLQGNDGPGKDHGEDDQAAHRRRGAVMGLATAGPIDPAQPRRQEDVERRGHGRANRGGEEENVIALELQEEGEPFGDLQAGDGGLGQWQGEGLS
jgi:hypothetical protein